MRSKRLEALLNALFWIVMTWLFVYSDNTMDVVAVEVVNGHKQIQLIRNMDKLLAFSIIQMLFLAFFYTELYFIRHLQEPKAVRGFVLKSIGSIVLCLLLCMVCIKMMVYPNEERIEGFEIIMLMNVFYMAVVSCYGFTKNWIKHEQDKTQLVLLKSQVELQLLRQQLQPHFLFNTMNNLLAMVNQHQQPKLAEGIITLSDLLRYVVYDTSNKRVAITKEISFLENFSALHLLRFEEDEVEYHLTIMGKFQQQYIAPGIFLCYVENAFKHGVQPEGKAFIHIQIKLEKEHQIFFQIENSIPAVPFKNASGGVGLKSNQERLTLAYPEQHSISIEEDSTYKVTLILDTNDRNYS